MRLTTTQRILAEALLASLGSNVTFFHTLDEDEQVRNAVFYYEDGWELYIHDEYVGYADVDPTGAWRFTPDYGDWVGRWDSFKEFRKDFQQTFNNCPSLRRAF